MMVVVTLFRELWRSVMGASPDPETIRPQDPKHVKTLQRADRLISREEAIRTAFEAADRKVHR